MPGCQPLPLVSMVWLHGPIISKCSAAQHAACDEAIGHCFRFSAESNKAYSRPTHAMLHYNETIVVHRISRIKDQHGTATTMLSFMEGQRRPWDLQMLPWR